MYILHLKLHICGDCIVFLRNIYLLEEITSLLDKLLVFDIEHVG